MEMQVATIFNLPLQAQMLEQPTSQINETNICHLTARGLKGWQHPPLCTLNAIY
jgi:hypothetical protein